MTRPPAGAVVEVDGELYVTGAFLAFYLDRSIKTLRGWVNAKHLRVWCSPAGVTYMHVVDAEGMDERVGRRVYGEAPLTPPRRPTPTPAAAVQEPAPAAPVVTPDPPDPHAALRHELLGQTLTAHIARGRFAQDESRLALIAALLSAPARAACERHPEEEPAA